MRSLIALPLSVLTLSCGLAESPVETPSEGTLVAAGGHRLFYRFAGVGPDTVVVVHGFQGNGHNYLAGDLEGLLPGHSLLFYDQRGGGRSDPVDDDELPGLMDHVADLEAVRTELGLGRLELLGHSGGAYVAIQYALSYPENVSRIALVAPGPASPDYAAEIGAAFSSRLDSATWARLGVLNAALPTAPDPAALCREISSVVMPRVWLADPSAAVRMRGSMCDAPASALRSEAAMRRVFETSIAGRNWTTDLGRVTQPILIVHGDHDAIPVAAAEQWRATLPNARLVLVADADHLPWLDRPEDFVRAVAAFFQEP